MEKELFDNDSPLSWKFSHVWNKSLETREEREMKPRDYIWASELGGSMIDRYLKMKAIKPTNPPNARSLRKFEAGNIWEWLIGLILRQAGILLNTQEWLRYQYPDLISVTGKLDMLAGGQPDYDKAINSLKALILPEVIERGAADILKYLIGMYPNGLKNIVLEIKSVSSFMFERYEKIQKANNNHRMQLFHYLKSKGMDEGHVIYICRDDCRMMEIEINNPGEVENEYKADISMLTEYTRANQEPPHEKEILWDEDENNFSKNWKIEYSNYLTMLYGYKQPDEYADKVSKKIGSWNRVVERIKSKKKMTKKNLEIIDEIKKEFPTFKTK